MNITLQLEKRDVLGKAASRKLRRQKKVPAVLYGAGESGRHFSLAQTAAEKLRRAGAAGLINLDLGPSQDKVAAIAHDWQAHPVSGRVEHIDFYQVRMDKALHTDIALEFIGVASAVKDLGGTLVKQLTVLPVECLPKDLVPSIAVDIGKLASFEDYLRVKDLVLPAGVKARLEPEAIVAAVAAPRSEEELAALSGEVKADVAKVEVVGEKKAEEKGEETAEETADKKSEK